MKLLFWMKPKPEECICGHLRCYHYPSGLCARTLCGCKQFIQAVKIPGAGSTKEGK